MANQDTEIEVANTSTDSGFSMKKLVIVIVIVQVIMFGGLAAFLTMSGLTGGGGQNQAAGEEGDVVNTSEPIYIAFEKFTVNFGGRQASHFMQVEIQAMTHDPDIQAEVTKHMPVIRNRIILILSSQTLESVTSLEGKDNLREQILIAVQEILQQRSKKTGIEEIYFTSFVMQ
jgi:flagellar FliL protein